MTWLPPWRRFCRLKPPVDARGKFWLMWWNSQGIACGLTRLQPAGIMIANKKRIHRKPGNSYGDHLWINLQNQDSPATPLQGFDAIDAWERHAGPVATRRDRENSVAAS